MNYKIKKIIMIVPLFLVFTLAKGQMVLEYDIKETNTPISLPLSGSVNVLVDWGDETQKEKFIEAGIKSHNFITTGIKIVTIKGTLTSYGSNSNIDYYDPGDQFINNIKNENLIKVISWDGLGLIDLSDAFFNAIKLIEVPNTLPSTVIKLKGTFFAAKAFNQDISNWDTKNITDMEGMFYGALAFNQNINNWNTGKVTNMTEMFTNSKAFNQPLSNWNTENVKLMSRMFDNAVNFNQDISNWNTTNVTNMNLMFEQARNFNQDISKWNTSNVTSMRYMFHDATSFNQNIETWNTSNVKDMKRMFLNAKSFNQDISNWNIENIIDMKGFFSKCGIDENNYSKIIITWANKTDIPKGINLGAYGMFYTKKAISSRDLLTNPIESGGKGWIISGDRLME